MAKNQNHLDQVLVPMFDKDSGFRMRLIRMKFLWDQKELARRLGTTQSQICKIERGKQEIPSFTFAQFKAVFDKFYSYILLNVGSEQINMAAIAEKYHRIKYTENRKPGSGLWKKTIDV